MRRKQVTLRGSAETAYRRPSACVSKLSAWPPSPACVVTQRRYRSACAGEPISRTATVEGAFRTVQGHGKGPVVTQAGPGAAENAEVEKRSPRAGKETSCRGDGEGKGSRPRARSLAYARARRPPAPHHVPSRRPKTPPPLPPIVETATWPRRPAKPAHMPSRTDARNVHKRPQTADGWAGPDTPRQPRRRVAGFREAPRSHGGCRNARTGTAAFRRSSQSSLARDERRDEVCGVRGPPNEC